MHSYMSPPRAVCLAHRARTWRASKRDTAHVSANLIYFGPDKKLIYREAGPVLGNDVFLRPRENRKWRTDLPGSQHGPSHDEILSRDEVKKNGQAALKRKRRGGIETSKFGLKRMFESLEIENQLSNYTYAYWTVDQSRNCDLKIVRAIMEKWNVICLYSFTVENNWWKSYALLLIYNFNKS